MSDEGDSVATSMVEESVASSNPPVTEGVSLATDAAVIKMLHEQEGMIDSLSADVRVLRESGAVMESRLQKMHTFLCDFMGDKCDEAFREMRWDPVIQIHNETQVLKKTKGPKTRITKAMVRGEKGGDVVIHQVDDSLSGDGDEQEKRYSVNYDKALSTDTAGRCLYGVNGVHGFCLTYTVLDFFKFDDKLVTAKTKKALEAAGVRSLAHLIKDEGKHYVAVLSFITEMLMSETKRFQDRKPLFLESALDVDDLGRTATVIANVQPEPVRSALALVLKQWVLPETEALAGVFLRVLAVVEGYVSSLREGHPPADAKRPQQDLDERGSGDEAMGGGGDSGDDDVQLVNN